LFPAKTALLFGVISLGVNYGLIFTSWGAGWVFCNLIGGLVRDWTGSYMNAFLLAVLLSFIGTGLTRLIRGLGKRKAEKHCLPKDLHLKTGRRKA